MPPRSTTSPRASAARTSGTRRATRSSSRSDVRLRPMEVEERHELAAEESQRDLSGVFRYYELAKRAEWQVKALPWGDLPPIPEYRGSDQKLARRRDLWRSVITQQLQADELAVEM